MHTGEIIRTLREKQGMSQESLAQRLGYKDRSSIAKIETGTFPPQPATKYGKRQMLKSRPVASPPVSLSKRATLIMSAQPTTRPTPSNTTSF